jgi:hypothetical protein
VTGVEKHAQAILDRHVWVNDGSHLICAICWGDQPWPCPDHDAAEAVLVAAREHDTRQAEIERLLELIRDHNPLCSQPGHARCNQCYFRGTAVAALRLLRGEDA